MASFREAQTGVTKAALAIGYIILLDSELTKQFAGVFRLDLPGADWYVFSEEQLSQLQKIWLGELAKEYGNSGKMWRIAAYDRLVEGNPDLAEPAIAKGFGVVYAGKARVTMLDGWTQHVYHAIRRVMWFADKPEYTIYSYMDRMRTYRAYAVDYEL